MTKHCTDCNVKLTKRTRTHGVTMAHELCSYCDNAAGLENSHLDGNVEADEVHDGCRDCGTYDPGMYWGEGPKQTDKRGPQTHRSHAACYAAKAHDKSPAGRAGCRKFRAQS